MAQKSLEQLRRENARLKQKARGKESLEKLSQERDLERRKLTAENKALRNPGSGLARKQFKSAAGKFGGFLKRGALRIHENLERQAAEEERRERMAEERNKKKTKRKTQTRRSPTRTVRRLKGGSVRRRTRR